MKSKSLILEPLVILAAGILLLCFFNTPNLIHWILFVVGLAILIPSAFNILWVIVKRSRSGVDAGNDTLSVTVSIIAGLLGIWIICAPAFFAGIMAFLFAIILVGLGALDIAMMVRDARPGRLPFIFYVIPVLMIAAGVVLIVTPAIRVIAATVVLITGIALTCSGVNRLIELVADRKRGTQA